MFYIDLTYHVRTLLRQIKKKWLCLKNQFRLLDTDYKNHNHQKGDSNFA